MEPLLTTDEVADILRVDAVTVRRMIQRGELDAYRVAGEYRFSTELLQAYLARQQLSRRAAEPEGAHPIAQLFSRLTPGAEQVLAHAQGEAHDFGHDYLGTEHVLLGLLAIDAGIATEALAASDVSAEAVRECLPAVLGAAAERSARCRMPPTTGSLRVMPRLKQALERAAREAHGEAVAPEHLLLGLLAVRDALAVGILGRLGVSPAELGRRVRALAERAQRAEGGGDAAP